MKKFIILSGVSGAGKTTTSALLGDKGYTCIDQYPIELIKNLFDLIKDSDSPNYQNVVLSIPICELEKYKTIIKNRGLKPTLILLDADRDEVINRYKFLTLKKFMSLIQQILIEKPF